MDMGIILSTKSDSERLLNSSHSCQQVQLKASHSKLDHD